MPHKRAYSWHSTWKRQHPNWGRRRPPRGPSTAVSHGR